MFITNRDRCGRYPMVIRLTPTLAISIPVNVTTEVVSSNCAHGEVYSI